MSKTLDQTDCRIIEILEADGRMSLADIGKEVDLSGPAVGERLRNLRDQGYVAGFGAKINLRALGYTIQALVRIGRAAGSFMWSNG